MLIIITIIIILVIRAGTIVKINGDPYYLFKLEYLSLQKHGLSNIDNIPNNVGAVFIFKDHSTVSFWMKDMKFPLDMYFLDNNGQVVDRKCNISPCDNIECPVIKAYDVKYVVEVKPREDCNTIDGLEL